MKEKKNWKMPRRDLKLHSNLLWQKSAVFNHRAMRPLHNFILKINSVEVSFSAIHTV